MNNSLLFFISLFISSIVLFNIFLILLDRKIKKLENKIIFLFERRTNIVPSLYEITKHYFNKHTEVFYQILHLRKREFSNYNDSFQERFNIEIQIHHELNFIFKVIHQHKKIKKESKYLLIEDLFLENSLEI